jgi:hypothetical protein
LRRLPTTLARVVGALDAAQQKLRSQGLAGNPGRGKLACPTLPNLTASRMGKADGQESRSVPRDRGRRSVRGVGYSLRYATPDTSLEAWREAVGSHHRREHPLTCLPQG